MNKLPVIIGPTASGKTHLAVELAKQSQGEIISGDSRQVYKSMDIGTGKDLDEYGDIPHYLINICKPGFKYNINLFYQDFVEAFHQIIAKNKQPILCGGSGLYIQTALEGNELSTIPVDQKLRAQLSGFSKEELVAELNQLQPTTPVDTSSAKRLIRGIEITHFLKSNPYPELQKPDFSPVLFGIDLPREIRRSRISERLALRFEEGMLEEVKKLLETNSPEDLKYYGLEYLFITEHLENKYSYDEMFSKLETAIHQFAKRQMTWFRKMEKDGHLIHWLPYDDAIEKKLNTIFSILKSS